MILEPMTPAPVAVLTARLPEPPVEVAYAYRLADHAKADQYRQPDVLGGGHDGVDL